MNAPTSESMPNCSQALAQKKKEKITCRSCKKKKQKEAVLQAVGKKSKKNKKKK